MKTIPIFLSILLWSVAGHAQNFFWGHSQPPVAPGGIAIVNVTTNYLDTLGNTLSTTIPATTAGNCLVLCMANYHSHATSFTTNGVSATLQITTNTYIGDPSTQQSFVEGWYLKNCGAGITTIVINTASDNAGGGNPGGFITVTFVEVSGLSTTSPYTSTERIAGTGGGYANTDSASTGGTINNGTANSIFFGVCEGNDVNVITGINGAGTDGTWIEPPNTRNTGAIAMNLSTVYQIVSTSSARTHVWSRVNNVKGTMGMGFVLHQ